MSNWSVNTAGCITSVLQTAQNWVVVSLSCTACFPPVSALPHLTELIIVSLDKMNTPNLTHQEHGDLYDDFMAGIPEQEAIENRQCSARGGAG